MTTTYKDVGMFLEEKIKAGKPIHYVDVVNRFQNDMPDLSGIWSSHPLCRMFGELDEQDARDHLPFRTAIVVAKETGMPGDGFFKTINSLRGPGIGDNKDEQLKAWLTEFQALISTPRTR